MNLKPFVNDKEMWQAFKEEIETRIRMAHRSLEQHKEYGDLRATQGSIEALRSLLQLREKVNGGN